MHDLERSLGFYELLGFEKLAGPIGSLIQRRTAQRYLTGLAGAEQASGR